MTLKVGLTFGATGEAKAESNQYDADSPYNCGGADRAHSSLRMRRVWAVGSAMAMPASQWGLNWVGIPNQLTQSSRMAGGSSAGQSTFKGRGRMGGRKLGSGIRSMEV